MSTPVCRYAENEELLLEGTGEALMALATHLKGGPFAMVLGGCADLGPYDGALESLVVEQQPGRVRIERRGLVLTLSGDDKSRAALAGNIERLAEGQLGPHVHIEHHPDHSFLDASSAPLVVGLL